MVDHSNTNGNILIVDDRQDNIDVLTEILSQENYTTFSALSGKEAIALASLNPPDLILLDVLMPEMDGYETCEIIKTNKKLKEIPVIFISTATELLNKVRAFEVGAIDFITRPFQIEEVLIRVKTHLSLYIYQTKLKDANIDLLNQFKNTFDQAAVGIIHTHPESGKISKSNKHFAKTLGYSMLEIMQLSIFDIIHPDHINDEHDRRDKIITSKQKSYTHEFKAISKHESIIWLNLTANLVLKENKDIDYIACIIENISERKIAEQKLRRSEGIYRGLMESSVDAVVIANERMEIVDCNDVCEKLFGYHPRELISQHIEVLIPEDLRKNHHKHASDYAKDSKSRMMGTGLELNAVKKDGTKIYVEVSLSPLQTDNGLLIATAIRDVTEKRLLHESLRERTVLLDEAQKLAHLGNWVWDIKSDTVIWSDELYNIYGINKDKIDASFKGYLSMVHPEDQHRVKKLIQSALSLKQNVHFEERILRPDGEIRFLKSWGTLILNSKNEAIKMIGACLDITETKQQQLTIAENEERLKLATSVGNIGIWDWDINKNNIIWDESMYNLYGIKAQDFCGAYDAWIKTLHPVDTLKTQEEVQKALNGEKDFDTEFRIITPSGAIKHIHSTAATYFDTNKKAIRMIGVNIDLTESRNTEHKLRRNELRLKEAQFLSKIGNWELDLTDNSLFWSDEVYNIFGKNINTFTPTYETFLESIHPEDIEKVNEAYSNHIKNQKPYKIEHRIILKNKTIKYVLEHCYSEFDIHGKAIKSIGTVQDITEKKKSEIKIKENEQKFRNIFENSVVGFYRTTINGEILMSNTTLIEMLGYDSFESLKKDKKINQYLNDSVDRNHFLNTIREHGKVLDLESVWTKKDGSTIFVSESAKIIKDEDGNELYFEGSVVDITARKLANEALQNSEMRYKTLYNTSSDAIFMMKDDTCIETNETALKMFNCTREEIINQKPYKYSPTKQPDGKSSLVEARKRIQAALEGNPQFFEWKHLRSDGKLFDAEVNLKRIDLSTGVYYQAIVRDITQRKKAEKEIKILNENLEKKVEKRTKALKLSEEKFRDIAELLPQAIFETDINGKLTYTNKFGLSSTGYKKSDLKNGLNIYDIIAKKDHKRITENIAKRFRGEEVKSNEYTLISKKKEEIPIMIYSAPIIKESKAIGLRGVLINIADIKKAETEIRKLSEAVIQSPTTVVITDPDGIIEYVNPKFTELTGYTQKESIGKKPNILYSGFHNTAFFKDLWTTIKAGNTWKGELCNKKKNGEIFWESANISSIKNTKNEILHYIAVKEDITLKKQLEDELTSARDLADAANQAKSDFLANMSHEIRTPLNAVLGFSELLTKLIDDEVQKSYIDAIKSSGKSLLSIIDDILDLSKIEAGKLNIEYSNFRLSSIIQEIEAMFSHLIHEKGLNFKVKAAKNIPAQIYLDELRMRQILINLMSNAVKFTDSGYINISAKSKIIDTNTCDIIIKVEDTGIGIAPQSIQKIFDSFMQQEGQSTKKYGGTGLGLSISNKLVQLLNGDLEVSSEIGTGSTFTLTFKNVKYSNELLKEEKQISIQTDSIDFIGAKVLIVDDEDYNRKFIADALNPHNVEVLEASNGKEALNIIKSNEIQLIISDLKMPVMDGFELLIQIRKLDELNEIPVIATTASVMRRSIKKVKKFDFSGLLIKPFQIHDLILELTNHLPYNDLYEPGEKSDEDELTSGSLVAIDNYTDFEKSLEKLIELHSYVTEQQAKDDINRFIESLEAVTNKYNIPVLAKFKQSIEYAQKAFDIESLLKLIKKFPKLIKELSKHVNK